MPIEDFEILEDLGKGSFGSVVKVKRREDGEIYAMKQIKIHRLKQKDKKNALNEIRFLASIDHPNIVSYKEAFYDEDTQNLCVVMQFANEGDLAAKIKKHLNAKIRIKQEFIWKMAYEILEGLNKLHESKIIHRDIKPANIFFHEGVAQLGDLNVAKHLKDPFTVTQTGTPYYASPEVWNEQPYDYKSDIWSLGCVLYQTAMLKPPFRADSPQKLYKKVIVGEYDPLASCYSKQLSSFIGQLLLTNHKQRPCSKQLLCHTKLLEMRQQISTHDEQNQKQFLKTIKFPSNLKQLNQKLPKSQYDLGEPPAGMRCKTAKIIKMSREGQEGNHQLRENSKLIKMNAVPSLKMIVSQKCIGLNRQNSCKQIIKDPHTRAKIILSRVPSKKLIL